MFWKPKRLAQPRAHHYTFAHHVLRQVCASDPVRFFALMASDEQRKFLAWMWKEAERHAKDGPAGASLDDVKVVTCRAKGLPAVVIVMSKTLAMAEAQMVAAILMGEPTEEAPKPKIRYFTLEDGEHSDGSARTVLCEWTEQRHANFGDGPPPDVQAFIAAIEQRLQ